MYNLVPAPCPTASELQSSPSKSKESLNADKNSIPTVVCSLERFTVEKKNRLIATGIISAETREVEYFGCNIAH